jgi:hypothetical protein
MSLPFCPAHAASSQHPFHGEQHLPLHPLLKLLFQVFEQHIALCLDLALAREQVPSHLFCPLFILILSAIQASSS